MQADVTGSRKLSAAVARIANEEFEKISQRRGRLTPAYVVEAARHPKHPLHSQFNWDLKKAAYQHWLHQAAELIRSVRVVFRMDPNDKPRTIRAHVSVIGSRGREYVPFIKAMSVAEHREQLLVDAMRELQAFRQKYKDLSVLAPVFEAIGRVRAPRKAA